MYRPTAFRRSPSPRTTAILSWPPRAEHFEVLLGLLKIFAHAPEGDPADDLAWRHRAHAAIVKAEAILAGARDPDGDGGAS